MRPEDLRARFQEYIAPDLQREGSSGDGDPVLVLIGGQPGSGKSRAMTRVLALHSQRIAPVVGDELRQFHPDYRRLANEDPVRMPEVTAPASAAWVQMSMEYAREHRISVAVEGTFRRPEVPAAAIAEFAAAGYRVHVAALGVPAWQSRLSTVGRFVQDHAAGRAARWTPLEAHEAGYVGTPVVLDAVTRDERVWRVSVLDRDGIRYDGHRGSDDLAKALTVLHGCRQRRPDGREARDWLTNHSEWIRYLQREFPERAVAVREALSVDAGVMLDAVVGRGQGVSGRAVQDSPSPRPPGLGMGTVERRRHGR